MYKVFDSLGNLMRKFSTYQAAAMYKMTFGDEFMKMHYDYKEDRK